MTYRPYISKNIHKRVQLQMVGESGDKKEWYEQGIETLLDDDGEKQDWLQRIENYAEENDVDEVEVLNKIVTAAIDEDGEANLMYKEKIGL